MLKLLKYIYYSSFITIIYATITITYLIQMFFEFNWFQFIMCILFMILIVFHFKEVTKNN